MKNLEVQKEFVKLGERLGDQNEVSHFFFSHWNFCRDINSTNSLILNFLWASLMRSVRSLTNELKNISKLMWQRFLNFFKKIPCLLYQFENFVEFICKFENFVEFICRLSSTSQFSSLGTNDFQANLFFPEFMIGLQVGQIHFVSNSSNPTEGTELMNSTHLEVTHQIFRGAFAICSQNQNNHLKALIVRVQILFPVVKPGLNG